MRLKVFAIERQNRQDNAEAQKIDEDGDEDHHQRRAGRTTQRQPRAVRTIDTMITEERRLDLPPSNRNRLSPPPVAPRPVLRPASSSRGTRVAIPLPAGRSEFFDRRMATFGVQGVPVLKPQSSPRTSIFSASLCTATRSKLRAATRLFLTAEQIMSHRWTRMNTDKRDRRTNEQEITEATEIRRSPLLSVFRVKRTERNH